MNHGGEETKGEETEGVLLLSLKMQILLSSRHCPVSSLLFGRIACHDHDGERSRGVACARVPRSTLASALELGFVLSHPQANAEEGGHAPLSVIR